MNAMTKTEAKEILTTYDSIIRRERAASAQAASENRGASKLVGSGEVVLLRRASAEALMAKWHERERELRKYAAMDRADRNIDAAVIGEEVAEAFNTCAEDFRRLLARATERQPQENAEISHDRNVKRP